MTYHQTRRSLLSALALGLTGLYAGKTGAATLRADKIMVYKSRRTLHLMRNGAVTESFLIALGPHPIGPKMSANDGRTPEGFYMVDARIRHTPYHLSLHLDYPNEIDRITSEEEGVRPGGNICIHGMPAEFGHTDPIGYFKDWTDGCVAVGNKAIERIWDAVDIGTPVEIKA